jgi:hypothetical protein
MPLTLTLHCSHGSAPDPYLVACSFGNMPATAMGRDPLPGVQATRRQQRLAGRISMITSPAGFHSMADSVLLRTPVAAPVRQAQAGPAVYTSEVRPVVSPLLDGHAPRCCAQIPDFHAGVGFK